MGTTATGTPPPLRGMNPLYPCSDGMPMAENGLQYQWIVTLHSNLDDIFAANPDVFVAADNLIYPVEGDAGISQAPDVYVAFGRPKGHRGSYIVHEEGGVFPQVVIEVRSPNNRAPEMARKLAFYDRHGAEEYYDFDPQKNRLVVYVRAGGALAEVPNPNGFVSPRLGVRFDTSGPELAVYRPTGERFLTAQQVMDARAVAAAEAEAERRRAETEKRRADAAKRRADKAAEQADAAAQEVNRLRELLRAAGIDPDAPAR